MIEAGAAIITSYIMLYAKTNYAFLNFDLKEVSVNMKDNRVDVGPAATIVQKVGVYWAHLILNFDQLYEMQNIFVTGTNEK